MLCSVYGFRFGTYLQNKEFDRYDERYNLDVRTLSIWSIIEPNRAEFTNPLFAPSNEV